MIFFTFKKINCILGVHDIDLRKVPKIIKTYPRDRYYDHASHSIVVRNADGRTVEVIRDIDQVQSFLAYIMSINVYNAGEFVEYYCKDCKKTFGKEMRLDV